jgi:hypothetical protein
VAEAVRREGRQQEAEVGLGQTGDDGVRVRLADGADEAAGDVVGAVPVLDARTVMQGVLEEPDLVGERSEVGE